MDTSPGYYYPTPSTLKLSNMDLNKPLPHALYGLECPLKYSDIRPRLSIDSDLVEDPFIFDSRRIGGDDSSHASSEALWMTYSTRGPALNHSNDYIPSPSRRPQADSLPIRPSTARPQRHTHPTYSAFPPTPKPPHLSFEAEAHPQPWPLRTDSQARPVRSRANTTPSKFQLSTIKPSSLSTCTTLVSGQDASTAPSPEVVSPPPFVEPKSVFEEDEEEASNLAFFTAVFHRVHGSGGSLGRAEKKKKKEKRSIRRSASEAWKGVHQVLGLKR
ncbi:hypothetical protein B7494_g3116 [Chlorociboria aeruginascens]|nr:hypothetical protein B7494_g3116 [Chlorociboria aeruginascens]